MKGVGVAAEHHNSHWCVYNVEASGQIVEQV